MRPLHLAILTLLLPDVAAACATCACGDPTLTVVGVDKPFAGRVRLSTEGRYRWEQQATDDGVWHSDRIRADLGVSWAVTDRIVLALSLPIVSAGLRSPSLAWQRGTGLGDAAVRARFVVLRDRTHTHLGGLTSGLELPTAPRLQADAGYAIDDAQPGTGAWTPEVGLWYGGFYGAWSVFVSATGRWSSPGWGDRTVGAAGLGTVAAQVQPHDRVAVRASLDVRLQDADHVAGQRDTDTGGWLLQLAPALVVSPHTDVLLTLGVAIPLASDLGGQAREGVSPMLGVVVDL